MPIFAVNSQVNAFNGGWMEELSEANLIRVLGVGTALILLIIVIVGLDFEVSHECQALIQQQEQEIN